MSNRFKTIARFQYSTEAQIVKGRLEAEGIQVFLSDNLTIDTDPLVSHAIGGVKLKVLSKQALRAQHILESISKYSIDDEGQTMVCPNCKGQKIALFSTIKDAKSLFWFIFGVLFSSLPFYMKHKYRCELCQTEFNIK
ncbi:DUF2007 domain-containing protein [Tamlana sp. s12]|uniref:DUF2007 domain-containing protein n=1 Tax=Tamlana sp. s12 TaxID=1630406 RepID=UPI000800EED3|nr:DUF2007 domain-containing protein [Tamlana sp. s12]OBQ56984.1 hypothetical protein VQ01_00385 [Tamlana sp. s12]QQY82841.1 DUF2007 domain-containing protein [Tamlana sp. s12]